MGTRRSRHNKGRSPLYKDHRLVARNLLERPMYGSFPEDNWLRHLNTRMWWTDLDKFKLDVLCEADADIDGSADALGRKPTTLAWKARDLGLVLPQQWSRLIAPKRQIKLRSQNAAALAYPYITNPRPEHADLLAINSMIPKSIPDNMRADMCQEIAIAILEGRTTLEVLKSRDKSASYFIRKFYKENYEQAGAALSFSSMEDEDWNSDAVASSLAAKEWHREQFAERTSHGDTLRTFTAPTQFQAAWNDQIGRVHMNMHELGQFLNRDEVEEMMEAASTHGERSRDKKRGGE